MPHLVPLEGQIPQVAGLSALNAYHEGDANEPQKVNQHPIR